MVMSVMLSGQCRGVAWDAQGSEILGHHSPMMFNSWKVDSDLSKGWLMGAKGSVSSEDEQTVFLTLA